MKQKKNERVEVYYERLLKLTNSLQHETIDNLLTLVCEEGIYEVEAINNLLVPKNSKIILVYKA
jgi:hypothetical protein